MQNIFQLAASIVSIYVTLCFIRIILTWFPGVEYSPVGRFFSTLCDPYLNLFRKLPLRIGMIDFSPMISIGLLTLLSSVLTNTAQTGRIYIGGILANLIYLIWSVFSSLIMIFLVLLIIRFVVMLFSKGGNYYNSIWSRLDNSLSPLIFKLTKIFSGGRPMNYRSAILLAIIELLLCLFVGKIIIGIISLLLMRIPF